ncbi:hypothetical protein Patl1_35288 [Pistacia atlantica]|nr:hypothetical protein Patl1_35288 [Pistacia atlantica]
MASSSNPTLTATQPEVSSELQWRGKSIAMDSDIEDLETQSTTPNETNITVATVGNEEGDVNPFEGKKIAKTSVVWNDFKEALDMLLGYTFFDLVLIALMLCGIPADVWAAQNEWLPELMKSMMQKHDHFNLTFFMFV